MLLSLHKGKRAFQTVNRTDSSLVIPLLKSILKHRHTMILFQLNNLHLEHMTRINYKRETNHQKARLLVTLKHFCKSNRKTNFNKKKKERKTYAEVVRGHAFMSYIHDCPFCHLRISFNSCIEEDMDLLLIIGT